MAVKDPSPVVRLYLASAVQRLPVKIVFDDDRLKNYRVSPGLSVEPSVRVR